MTIILPEKQATRKEGKPFVRPIRSPHHLKLVEARMEFDCRIQAAAVCNRFIKHRAEYWKNIQRATESMPAGERRKFYAAAYAPLYVHHRVRNGTLDLGWHEEHKRQTSKTEYKRKKHVPPTKGGKSYDLGKLLKLAKPHEHEMVVQTEIEFRRIRAMWDMKRKLRKFIKEWLNLFTPDVLGVDLNDVGNWTLGPHTVTSEMGLEVLAELVGDSDDALR